jgi:hypothetical protein
MSEPQISENQIMQANKENKQEASNINSLNDQNKEIERNNPTNNQESNEDLKIGQYMLTPLQSIILNQKMPFGFKLETEENILKSLEASKNQTKKYKNSSKHKERAGRDTNRNGGTMPKKRYQNSNNGDNNIPSNATPEMYNLYKKCKKGLEKIKESRYSNSYYQSNNPDVPCLANIEKKVNNYEYKNLYDFIMDVRNIWGYYFKLEENNEITSKLSDEWEKICGELENTNNDVSVKNIKKRTEIIQKELDEYKDSGTTKENLPAPVKKMNQQNSEYNKPMTVEEKNQLGNNIRSLNKDQLKGIIKILSENNSVPKSKYFEFDIDKLSIEKLRELDKYVKECLNSNKLNSTNSSNNNISNNNIHKQNSNNKLQNQNNKSNNKGNNTPNQQLLKSNNKDMNKTQDNKSEQLAKKIKPSSNKKSEKNNESFSSESISSDSSLSN